MRVPASLIGLLAGLAVQAAAAQSIQGVVQVGPGVHVTTITQGSGLNIAGVIQIGGAPSATVTQSGAFNGSAVSQVGISTTANVSQSAS